MSSDEMPKRKREEIVCGSCRFFGQLALCPRRERYYEASTCRKYEEKPPEVVDKNKVDELYKKLLTEYAQKGFTNPEATLEHTIQTFVDKGKTRHQAILEMWEKESVWVRGRGQEKIRRLAVLFSRGEISEESYKSSVKAIEEETARLGRGTTTSTTREPRPPSASSDYDSQLVEGEGPSGLWYLVPFFFGIIGGLVGYVGVKDEDPDMASGLLVFGIVWSLVLGFIGYALFFSVIWR